MELSKDLVDHNYGILTIKKDKTIYIYELIPGAFQNIMDKNPGLVKKYKKNSVLIPHTEVLYKYLKPIMHDETVLYHGSTIDIKDGMVVPNDKVYTKVVYATNKKWYALLFAQGFSEYSFRIFNDSKHSVSKIIERYPGELQKRFGKPGYIYHVLSKDFKQDSDISKNSYEFFAFKPVKIMKKEYIPDLYKALKDQGECGFEFIHYDEFVEKVDKYK